MCLGDTAAATQAIGRTSKFAINMSKIVFCTGTCVGTYKIEFFTVAAVSDNSVYFCCACGRVTKHENTQQQQPTADVGLRSGGANDCNPLPVTLTIPTRMLRESLPRAPRDIDADYLASDREIHTINSTLQC